MKKMYTVFDRVSEQYLPPAVYDNDAVAIRSFGLSCCDLTIPDAYFDDISLVYIGDFDELSGAVHPAAIPHVVTYGNSSVVREMRNRYKEMMNNEKSEAQDGN